MLVTDKFMEKNISSSYLKKKKRKTWREVWSDIDRVIDYQGISTHLGLFYADRLGKLRLLYVNFHILGVDISWD